jgi:methionyl-tRNA formyltransferase
MGSDEFDTGDIIQQEKIRIKYPIKIKDAIDRIASLYQRVLPEVLNRIINGQTLDGVPQDQHKATYSLWRNEEDYKINWNKSSREIKRFIDAVGYPYKGAFSMINDSTVRIIDAEIEEDVKIINRDVGKVIFKKNICPVIVCGDGLLKINEAYSEDNKRLTFENEFRLRFQ